MISGMENCGLLLGTNKKGCKRDFKAKYCPYNLCITLTLSKSMPLFQNIRYLLLKGGYGGQHVTLI